MASVSMTLPLSSATQNRLSQKPSTEAFFRALPIRQSKKIVVSKPNSQGKLGINASLKEKAVTAITAAALTASIVIPEVAEAAESGVSPSLKNFLLSISAGGIVLGAIFGAVIGVSNFDPVKRN
ncbi:Photosystem II PsbX [Quillaja saponaria]|uniref:Photosystem II PsbX n=1 Tax=Quillaja saponaria TaxID=32244 RepID=A0AAD7LXY4_QUISA|nr:Photosystem II PsbX [Quillaja saponaria]